MIWPRPLPAPDPGRRARAGAIGRALLDPARCARAAAAWARALERPASVTALLGPSGPPPPAACAGWALPDGRAGRLEIDLHLIAGVVERLGGRDGVPVGPAPLSPAEEGLFAWLVLAWLELLPAPRPVLTWVHGGDPDWRIPDGGPLAITWRVELGDLAGCARWRLPPDTTTAAGDPRTVRVPLRIEARLAVTTHALVPGALLPLAGPPLLRHARGALCAVRARGGRLYAQPQSEVAMPTFDIDALPVTLTVRLGELVLTAGEVAALVEGQVLPLTVEDPPLVALRAGDHTVALGVLVDDGGRLSVQLTRVGG